ncbi:MAG: hypothetical protein ACLGIF_01530 [Actinomycetes bacterium]
MGLAAAALVLERGIAELLMNSLHLLAFGLAKGVDATEIEQLGATVDGLLALSSSLSASSLEQTVRHLLDADLKVVPIFLGSPLAAVYIVLRPFSSSFRIKRMLFNLAETPDLKLAHSSTTWQVSRSVGLYDKERALLDHLHLRGAREKPFDLVPTVTPC